jgi:hypothetical protein
MPPSLRISLLAVDLSMLAYWAVSLLAVAGIIGVPASIMYEGYGTPQIDAWNWSFAPLDLLFAATGLVSVRLARSRDARWRGWAIISLSLTFCAGFLAISFWTLIQYFALSWWLPNLLLVAVALWWLPRVVEVSR